LVDSYQDQNKQESGSEPHHVLVNFLFMQRDSIRVVNNYSRRANE